MEEVTPPHDSRRSVLARRCKAARTEAVGRLAYKQRVVVCPGRAKTVRSQPSSEDGLRRWTLKMDSEDGLPPHRQWVIGSCRRIKAVRAEAVGRLDPKQRSTKKIVQFRRASVRDQEDIPLQRQLSFGSSTLMQATRAEAVRQLASKRRVVVCPDQRKAPGPIRSLKSGIPGQPASRSDDSLPSGESSLV